MNNRNIRSNNLLLGSVVFAGLFLTTLTATAAQAFVFCNGTPPSPAQYSDPKYYPIKMYYDKANYDSGFVQQDQAIPLNTKGESEVTVGVTLPSTWFGNIAPHPVFPGSFPASSHAPLTSASSLPACSGAPNTWWAVSNFADLWKTYDYDSTKCGSWFRLKFDIDPTKLTGAALDPSTYGFDKVGFVLVEDNNDGNPVNNASLWSLNTYPSPATQADWGDILSATTPGQFAPEVKGFQYATLVPYNGPDPLLFGHWIASIEFQVPQDVTMGPTKTEYAAIAYAGVKNPQGQSCVAVASVSRLVLKK